MQVKEDLCFVSMDFLHDLKYSKIGGKVDRNSLVKDSKNGKLKKLFVLPDFKNVNRGYALQDDVNPSLEEQVLTMESERFSVPEVLFNPGDIGIDQAGVVEATWQSLQQLDPVS